MGLNFKSLRHGGKVGKGGKVEDRSLLLYIRASNNDPVAPARGLIDF